MLLAVVSTFAVFAALFVLAVLTVFGFLPANPQNVLPKSRGIRASLNMNMRYPSLEKAPYMLRFAVSAFPHDLPMLRRRRQRRFCLPCPVLQSSLAVGLFDQVEQDLVVPAFAVPC